MGDASHVFSHLIFTQHHRVVINILILQVKLETHRVVKKLGGVMWLVSASLLRISAPHAHGGEVVCPRAIASGFYSKVLYLLLLSSLETRDI